MRWEENVRKVVPYTPGEQPRIKNILKLNTNENPYPPAPEVTEVLRAFPVQTLRLYPDPTVSSLVQALADHHGLSPEQVFVGVGSDDVLALSFLTFFNSSKPILFPDITYSFYDVWAGLFRIPYETIPLDGDFQLCPQDYMRENGGIIFPNPNAPTGLFLPLSSVEEILAANRDVVVIADEAYIDFGGTSALELLSKYENLLVVRTFSKSRSMAGNRIGYALGNPKLIGYLKDVKYSFNSYTMDSITIQCGVASVKNDPYFKESCHKIITTREWTKEQLRRLGFTFPDSKSNFLFVSHRSIPAKELFAALRESGIVVRYFDKPRIDNYLRITIGTPEDMQRLIAFFTDYVAKTL
jgi:histidinol-phosphate aminotransferase